LELALRAADLARAQVEQPGRLRLRPFSLEHPTHHLEDVSLPLAHLDPIHFWHAHRSALLGLTKEDISIALGPDISIVVQQSGEVRREVGGRAAASGEVASRLLRSIPPTRATHPGNGTLVPTSERSCHCPSRPRRVG